MGNRTEEEKFEEGPFTTSEDRGVKGDSYFETVTAIERINLGDVFHDFSLFFNPLFQILQKWLDLHPNTSMGYSSNKAKAPAVVMDDCTVPVYGVAFGSSKGSAGASTATVSNTIVTTSMLNWEKNKEEIPQKEAQPVKSKVVKNHGDSFFIDDEEMFIASKGNSNSAVEDDYFVVL